MDVINQLTLYYSQLEAALNPYLGPVASYVQRAEAALPAFPYPIIYVAAVAIVLHVANYNITAQIEHKTRIFTKILGSPAVYFYAVYLVLSALVRDHYVMQAVEADAGSLVYFKKADAEKISIFLIGFGIFLNLWTLKALGIKGMYNGDSFGHLMAAPVTGGPYRLFNDPQYVGTTLVLLGYAIKHQSISGYGELSQALMDCAQVFKILIAIMPVLTAILYLTFLVSVHLIEGPHMRRIYAAKPKASVTSPSGKKKAKKFV
ncbi:hypothetical protein HK104_009965 [Borealophlyctis nickersoniae]|nr:hypothetical protein HK104_009965 [Borealophlyctis nickersoniae]